MYSKLRLRMLYRIKNSWVVFKNVFLSFSIVACVLTTGYAQQDTLKKDAMIQKFYAVNHGPLYWFSSNKNMHKATEWLIRIESSGNLGIVSDIHQSDQSHIDRKSVV